jgi:hypothetical protein
VVEVRRAANARWNATLTSSANRAGAVQMNGSATTTPGSNASDTRVSVDLSDVSVDRHGRDVLTY